jgi:hypothetical protein
MSRQSGVAFFKVKKISLIRSVLHMPGAIVTIVQRNPLNNNTRFVMFRYNREIS